MTDLLNRAPADLAAHLANEYHVATLDELQAAIDQQRRATPLRRLVEVLELSATEAGKLFGVTRQAFTKWLNGHVPSDRRVEIDDVDAGVRLLLAKLQRDAIAAVVRRPAASFNGRTLLEVLQNDGAAAFHNATHAMFDFGDIHR